MNISHKHFNENFQTTKHQSYAKHDEKNSCQTKYSKIQLKETEQRNLCSEKRHSTREEKMKLFHSFN